MEKEKLVCERCYNIYYYNEENTFWDENSSYGSTKLCRCPHCETPNVYEYKEDPWLDVNKDIRYYTYN